MSIKLSPLCNMYLSAIPTLQRYPPFSISLMTSDGQKISLCVIALYFPWWEVTRQGLKKPAPRLKAMTGFRGAGAGPGLIKSNARGPGSWHHTERNIL